MKLILTHEVHGLGAAGDVVEVKDGYGRNFLLPRKLATPWTKGGQKQVDSITAGRAARDVKSLEEAQSLKARLEEGTVEVKAKAGQGGRLFGAVTVTEVVDAIKAAGGPEVDRRRVAIKNPIKTTGVHTAAVRLHPEVVADVKLEVVEA